LIEFLLIFESEKYRKAIEKCWWRVLKALKVTALNLNHRKLRHWNSVTKVYAPWRRVLPLRFFGYL